MNIEEALDVAQKTVGSVRENIAGFAYDKKALLVLLDEVNRLRAAQSEPMAHIVTVRFDGKGKSTTFATLPGYSLEPGMTLLSDDPVYATPPDRASIEAAALERIYDAFGIGAQARTIDILMTNIGNLTRRADCLSAIEREFFMVSVDPDEPEEDPGEDCLLNWGANPDEYVEQFRAALKPTQPEHKCTDGGQCGIGGYCDECQAGSAQADGTVIDYGTKNTMAEKPAPADAQGICSYVVAGWMQFIHGTKTQNFARDAGELTQLKTVAEIMGITGVTYQEVYAAIAAKGEKS